MAPGEITGLLFWNFNHFVAGTSLNTSHALSHLILMPTLIIHNLHFTEKETEAQKN